MNCPEKCARCGGPFYGRVNTVGNSTEPRCFPHYLVRQGRRRIGERLRTEERYRLAHIDVGFPYVAGGVAEERMNALRESSWGKEQLNLNRAARLGFDR